MLFRIYAFIFVFGLVAAAAWTKAHPGSHAMDVVSNYSHMFQHAYFTMTFVGFLVAVVVRLRFRD